MRATARKRPLRIALLVLSAVAVTMVAYFPIVEHPNSTVLMAPGDESSSARDYWAAHSQHQNPFTLEHDSLFDAPDGRAVAPAVQIANALQPAVVLGVHNISGWLGAFNLFMLMGVAASLVATFLLLESFGFHLVACIGGAIAFGSSQWSVEQLLYGHVAFAQVWVFPLLLASMIWARRGRRIRAIVPGLAYALAFYAFSYLGLLATLLVAIFLVAVIWENRGVSGDLSRLGIGLVSACVGLMPAALATRIAPSSRIGLPPLSPGDFVGASLRDFFAPSSHHPIYGGLVRMVVGPHVGESVLFFGYVIMAFALLALVMLRCRRESLSLPVRFSVVAIPVAWLMSLPAREYVFGLWIPMPDPAEIVGGVVSWWRVYARLAAIAGLGLIILAAFALDKLVRSRRPVLLAVAVTATLAIALEALPGAPVATARLRVDPATAWLRDHPGGIIATYPMQPGKSDRPAWDSLYWSSYYLQMYHHHPVFDVPRDTPAGTVHAVAAMLVSDLSAPETPSILRAEGVRYVVVHHDVYRDTGQTDPLIRSGFTRAARFGAVDVLQVTARPADLRQVIANHETFLARAIAIGNPQLSYGHGFYGPEQYDGFQGARWLKQAAALIVEPAVARPYIGYELEIHAFSNSVPRRVAVYNGRSLVASFNVPTHDAVFRANLALPERKIELTFHTNPGPAALGPDDSRVASVYLESVSLAPVSLQLSGD